MRSADRHRRFQKLVRCLLRFARSRRFSISGADIQAQSKTACASIEQPFATPRRARLKSLLWHANIRKAGF